jgi:purine-nucleoside phosphorylase
MSDLIEQLDRATEAIARISGREAHDVVAVLGSGLGSYPESVSGAVSIPYSEIPGFPQPAVAGHSGTAYSAVYGENRVLLLSGRVHAYEGHDLDHLTFPVRAAVRAGCRVVLLTNAAGGCADGQSPGDLVLIADHINLTGRNPLVGPNHDELGPRFPDMSAAYSVRLRECAAEVAAELGQELAEGVYAWFLGPTFETPAEVQMARRLGADLVGMSTVPETIVARHMGAEVIAISLVTNLATGIADHPLSHEDVNATAATARSRFTALLDSLLARLEP